MAEADVLLQILELIASNLTRDDLNGQLVTLNCSYVYKGVLIYITSKYLALVFINRCSPVALSSVVLYTVCPEKECELYVYACVPPDRNKPKSECKQCIHCGAELFEINEDGKASPIRLYPYVPLIPRIKNFYKSAN